jgi:hypothetical protein
VSNADVPDEEAIRNILGRYYQYVDDHDYANWGTLLSEDFRMVINGRLTEGRDANTTEHVDEHPLSYPQGPHLLTNTVVTVNGDDATTTSDWIWIGEVGVLKSKQLLVLEMGRAVDTFRRIDGEWKMTSRDQRPMFFQPLELEAS